jgi:hypothetical protein
MRRNTVAAVAGLLAIVSLAVLGAQAQANRQSEDIMPALLAEVRGLRVAMEQMASGSARVQLALGRLQMQEQRVNNAIRRLDEVRARVSAGQRLAGEQQERLAAMERDVKDFAARGGARAAGESGPSLEELQQVTQSIRNELGATTAELQRVLAEEATLANDVAAEQSRWTAINQQLEEIERTLSQRR